MYFSSAFVLTALPFLVGAVPTQNSARSVLSIPLSKRSTLPNNDGVVDVQNLQDSVHHAIAFVFSVLFFEKGGALTTCSLRKFEQGFDAFESNTGNPHPLAPTQGHSNKRRGGAAVSLTNYRHNEMWYGNISVGSPAATYTGRSLFRVARM